MIRSLVVPVSHWDRPVDILTHILVAVAPVDAAAVASPPTVCASRADAERRGVQWHHILMLKLQQPHCYYKHLWDAADIICITRFSVERNGMLSRVYL